MTHKNLFLVEDDKNLGFVIKDNLVVNGFQVTHFDNGLSAWEGFMADDFDMCILDIMLPKMDGFELGTRIREINKKIPIIFLSAKSLQEDKLMGFELGGDDYITKPFSMEELIYRIGVFLKRTSISDFSEKARIKIGNYYFDHDQFLLTYEDDVLRLTLKETELLYLFAQNQNKVLKRDEILMELWGDDDYFKGRSLDVFISRLRKHLIQDPSIQIVNYHGVGFRLSVK